MTISNSETVTGYDLLRGLVYWEKPNSEIQARLDNHAKTAMDLQSLALNKETMTVDPDNPESVYDGFDGRNSVLRIIH